MIEINEIETEMEDQATWMGQPPEQRREREERRVESVNHMQALSRLANETVNLLDFMTKTNIEVRPPPTIQANSLSLPLLRYISD